MSTSTTENEVLTVKSEFLGKQGHISTVLKSLKNLSADEKKLVGPEANKIKQKTLP